MGKEKTQVREAARYLQEQRIEEPEIAIILGSGLSGLSETLSDSITIPYENIPNFPASTVEGHPGNLVSGKFKNKTLLLYEGRKHLYEGESFFKTTFNVQLAAQLGIEVLIITCSAGGLNPYLDVGDVLFERDYIDLQRKGEKYLDSPLEMKGVEPCSMRIRNLANECALEENFKLREGIICGLEGPTFETPAEANMLKRFGFDAVSMSTVPEIKTAISLDLEFASFAVITNMHKNEPHSHEEVLEASKVGGDKLYRLLLNLIPKL